MPALAAVAASGLVSIERNRASDAPGALASRSTVYTGPDIAMTTAPDACATNHQHMPVPDEQEQFTRTQERLSAVRAAGDDVAAMLKPPIYQVNYADGLGTVYTARYWPGDG